MEWDWRVIKNQVDSHLKNGINLNEYCLLVIQHLLPDLKFLLQSFEDLGINEENIFVVGIPYSSLHSSASELKDSKKYNVFLPNFYPFEAYVQTILLKAIEHCKIHHKKLLIVEDGGYLAPIIYQISEHTKDIELIKGIVEQTTRGLVIDQKCSRENKLLVPVISIPHCNTKKKIEGPYIAKAVLTQLQSLLRQLDVDITKIKNVGIFGYSFIGSCIADYFKSQKADVYVTDLNPDKQWNAYVSSHNPPLNDESIPKCELIIGTTGSTSVNVNIIAKLMNNAILVSSSSRQIEIDMEFFYDVSAPVSIGKVGPSVMQIPAAKLFTYTVDRSEKNITVLYDGFPINFWGESLPHYVGDSILSLLLEGAIVLATENLHNKIYPGNEILQNIDRQISGNFELIKIEAGIDDGIDTGIEIRKNGL